MKSRDQFTSRLGMILATIGFAAGVGNLWRFPYIAGEHGGGIFLLFYLAIILIIGIPILTVEISLGAATNRNPVGAYKNLAPNKPWFLNGYLNVLAAVIIIAYTLPVYGWILKYIFEMASGTFAGMGPQEIGGFFNEFMMDGHAVLFWVIINIALTVAVVRNELKKGVEKIAKILLPVLVILMLVLIFRGVTLPGGSEGLAFYLTPDFSQFTGEAVFAALGQAFFSIGIAMAASLVFGSYLQDKDKQIVSNSTIIVLADSIIAIMAGFLIFPIVFAFGLEPATGPELTFVTMPNVFNEMAGGVFWGFLFYLTFYIAAFTSAIAGWEAVISFFKDEFNMARKKAVWVTLFLVAIIGLPSIYSMEFFDIIDYIQNNFILILGGLFMVIFVGWDWGMDNFCRRINIKSDGVKIFWTIMVKYVIPLFILTIFLNNLL